MDHNRSSVGRTITQPAELMPSTTIFYVEGASSDTVLKLPLVSQLTSSALFAKIWTTPDVMKLRGGITLAEVALGDRLPQVLGKLTEQGWVLAIDGESKAVVLWAHARDAATCQEMYKKLLTVAQSDANSKSKELKQVTYREVDAFEANGTIVAGMADYLVVASKGELLKSLVDRWRDASGTVKTDGKPERFQELKRATNKSTDTPSVQVARAWLDVRQLRDSGLAKKL